MIGKIVMVGNESRTLMAGKLESYDPVLRVAVLTDARMAVRWSEAMKGVLGLAGLGPDKDCRIGPSCARVQLAQVCNMAEVSPDAWAKWEAAPWGR